MLPKTPENVPHLLEIMIKNRFQIYKLQCILDNLHKYTRLNLYPSKKNENRHHSSKERLRISEIAKFGCEIS
jgi:hypothetical protein